MVLKFSFEAWVHPKQGGDDYPIAGTIELRMQTPHDEQIARQEVERLLKKRGSAVLTDYQIRPVIIA